MKRLIFKMNSTLWFIALWLFGFIGLAIIAGIFRLMLYFAYP